jgi:hypothetical protein
VLEIRKPSLESQLIDYDVNFGREGISEDSPDRLEQAMERVVQGTSAFIRPSARIVEEFWNQS